MRRAARAWGLPALAFAAVFGLHASLASCASEAQSRWAALPMSLSDRLAAYASSGQVWLGYCYALSAAFAAWALVDYFLRRSSAARTAGGLAVASGLAGVLAGAACFLVGCCGSPMLAVWVALLGAAAAPWLGPAAALLTTVSIVIAGRMLRRGRCGPSCGCA